MCYTTNDFMLLKRIKEYTIVVEYDYNLCQKSIKYAFQLSSYCITNKFCSIWKQDLNFLPVPKFKILQVITCVNFKIFLV